MLPKGQQKLTIFSDLVEEGLSYLQLFLELPENFWSLQNSQFISKSPKRDLLSLLGWTNLTSCLIYIWSKIWGKKLVRGVKNFWFVKYSFSAFFCTKHHVKSFKTRENMFSWKWRKIEGKIFSDQKRFFGRKKNFFGPTFFFLNFFLIFKKIYFREF